ncbi:MAG: hypothetical protein ACRDE7_14395, partial [Sphingobacterium sp.]
HKGLQVEFTDQSTNKAIPKSRWTAQMHQYAEQELSKFPMQKRFFKIPVVGWLFLLFAFGLLGYLVYQSLQQPAKKEAYELKMTDKAKISVGDIYFGNYRVYKEKGEMLSSTGGFGWFKIVTIENDVYHIAKSISVSKRALPKEEMNSQEFETETSAVKPKVLEAYTKQFVSENGLIEFNFNEKKE